MSNFYEVVITEDAAPVKAIVHGIRKFGMHWHEELEIVLVLKGSIKIRIGENLYILKENDLILINSKEIHSTEKTNEENMVLALQIHPDYYRYFYPEFSHIRFNCNSFYENKNNVGKYDLIRHIVAKIFWELNKKVDGYKLTVANDLNNLVSHLINNFDNDIIKGDNDRVLTRDIERIESILKYIDYNIERKITLKEVSEYEGISSYYLSHFFRKNIGISFQQYLNIKRLDKAVNLLLSTDNNIIDIVFQTGFSSTNYFNRVFREYYNCTPTEYRRDNRNGESQNTNYINKKSKSYLDVDRVSVFESLFKYLNLSPSNIKAETRYSINTVKENIIIDINKSEEKKYNPYWKNLICFGRASEGLRLSVQRHIREVQREISFNYIRFHGIFSDEMMIYNINEEGKVSYNWTYVDELFDFFMEINIKPFIGLGFMPSELKRSDETVYWWKGNISPPKNINLWTDLVKEFVKHCINRYGIEEVKTWYFEVWNEPELEYVFWAGTKEEYFQFFKDTVLAVKSIAKELKISGPAVSPGIIMNSTWLVDFLKYTKKNNITLDFISAHIYPEYIPTEETHEVEELLKQERQNQISIEESTIYHDKDHTQTTIRYINDKSQEILGLIPEIHITEWNTSSQFGNLIHDTVYVSSYITKNILDSIGKVESLGYWALTDIFEENKLGVSHFHGGFGLINKDGLKKPSYYAYYLLNKLGNTIIEQRDGYIVTRNNEDIQILVYNFAYFDKLFLSGDTSALDHKERYNIFEKVPSREINLDILGLNGNYKIRKYKLNQDNGSVYDEWVGLGAPENMTGEEIRYLEGISKPKISIEEVKIDEEYNNKICIPVHGIELITINKII